MLNYKASLDKVEQETARIHRCLRSRDKESRLRGTLSPGQATQIHGIENLSRHRGWNHSGEPLKIALRSPVNPGTHELLAG